MRENSKKTMTIFFVTIAFVLVFVLVFQFASLAVASSKEAELKNQIVELEQSIVNISDEIEYRETLLYIEKYARENLDLYGENDIIFQPNS